MKQFEVAIYTTTRMANYITVEADSVEAAADMARDIWYEDDRAFSARLLDETVEDIHAEVQS